jgi:HK97 family phage major capsid protein
MALATTNTPAAFTPDAYGSLVIATASKISVALQVTTVVNSVSSDFRIPVVTGEVSAGWYAENTDITLADVGTAEEVVTPRKIAGLSKISNELANDSTPAASEIVGNSIARSIATGIDAAFFGSAPGTGVPPKGIGAFTDALVTTISAGTAWANVDPFTDAIFAAETAGASLTSFIANPADAQILAKLKKETGSNEPLLSPDATSPTTRRLAGLPRCCGYRRWNRLGSSVHRHP